MSEAAEKDREWQGVWEADRERGCGRQRWKENRLGRAILKIYSSTND